MEVDLFCESHLDNPSAVQDASWYMRVLVAIYYTL